MGRTARGECARPCKKRGAPKKNNDDEPVKCKQADGHKRREEKRQDAGKGFVGDVPTYQEMEKLNLFSCEKSAIEHMAKHGVTDFPDQCQRCSSPIKPNWKEHRFRCRKEACRWTPPTKCDVCLQPMLKPHPEEDQVNCTRHCSNLDECGWTWNPGQGYNCCFFNGSIAYDANVPKNETLHLLWLWCLRTPVRTASKMIGWSEGSVGRWHRHLRLMTVEMLLSKGYCASQVGGEGIIVEMDESKFGKRKYNRGRRVNGSWVLGMVERTEERRMVLVVVPDRTRETLEPVIDRFIAEGSTIHTDMWKACDKLEEMPEKNCRLERLCHKCEFVSEKGIHTQTIEGNWRAIKKTVPSTSRNGHDLQEFLFECMWRRQHKGNVWNGLLEGLSRIRHTAKMLKAAQEGRDVQCEEGDDDWELPRNARPRDVKFEYDSDGSAARRDTEVVAASAMADLIASASTPSQGTTDDGTQTIRF